MDARTAGVAALLLLFGGCGDSEVDEVAPLRWLVAPDVLSGGIGNVDVAVDSGGNVVVAGDYEGAFALGGETLTASTDSELFVGALSAEDGHTLTLARYGFHGDDHFADIGVDPQGRVVMLGRTDELGPFVVQRAADGAVRWLTRFPRPDYWYAHEQLAIAPNGDVFVTLHFYTTIEVGGELLESVGGPSDAVLVRLSGEDGAVEWARQIGNQYWNRGEQVNDLAAGPASEVAITGYYRGPLDFGGGDRDSYLASQDIFVAVYEADGTHRWSTRLGGSGDLEEGTGVAFDSSGDVYVGGHFERGFAVGDESLASSRDAAFVLRLAGADGEALWARGLGTGTYAALSEVFVDDADTVIVSGHTQLVEQFLEEPDPTQVGGAAYAARFAADGQLIGMTVGTSPQLGGRTADHVQGTAATLALTGRFEAEISIESGVLRDPEGGVFVAAFDNAIAPP